jgi:hypothetical protein
MPDLGDELSEAWTWRKSLAGVERIPGGASWGVACNCHDDCYCLPRWWPNDPNDDRSWPAGRVFTSEGIALAHLRDFVTAKASRLRTRARELDRIAARLPPDHLRGATK